MFARKRRTISARVNEHGKLVYPSDRDVTTAIVMTIAETIDIEPAGFGDGKTTVAKFDEFGMYDAFQHLARITGHKRLSVGL